jgi:hypothetical protein
MVARRRPQATKPGRAQKCIADQTEVNKDQS